MIYATRGLVESLLRQAADRDPDELSMTLATTAAGDLYDGDFPDVTGLPEDAGESADADLEPTTPVFTHFYMPNAAGSVSAVFGVDLGTPNGPTQGRFVSHPMGRLRLQQTDDFHALIFVAVPPWDTDSLAVFDRHGSRQELTLLDVEPPEETPTLSGE